MTVKAGYVILINYANVRQASFLITSLLEEWVYAVSQGIRRLGCGWVDKEIVLIMQF